MLMVVSAKRELSYYALYWMMFGNFHCRVLKVGRVNKGVQWDYINDLFMEQLYHNLPSPL